MNPTNENNQTCKKCGNSFTCYANTPVRCWCCDLPNIMPVPDEKNIETGCFCPDCLKKMIAKNPVS